MNKIIFLTTIIFLTGCGMDHRSHLDAGITGIWQPFEGADGDWVNWAKCSSSAHCLGEAKAQVLDGEVYDRSGEVAMKQSGSDSGVKFHYRNRSVLKHDVLKVLNSGKEFIVNINTDVKGSSRLHPLKSTPSGDAQISISVYCSNDLLSFGNCASPGPNPLLPASRWHCDQKTVGFNGWHNIESTVTLSNFNPKECEDDLTVSFRVNANKILIKHARWKLETL
jgi:hypothetical protein